MSPESRFEKYVNPEAEENTAEIERLKNEIQDFKNERTELAEKLSFVGDEEKEKIGKIEAMISSITADIETREKKIEKLNNP